MMDLLRRPFGRCKPRDPAKDAKADPGNVRIAACALFTEPGAIHETNQSAPFRRGKDQHHSDAMKDRVRGRNPGQAREIPGSQTLRAAPSQPRRTHRREIEGDPGRQRLCRVRSVRSRVKSVQERSVLVPIRRGSFWGGRTTTGLSIMAQKRPSDCLLGSRSPLPIPHHVRIVVEPVFPLFLCP